MGRKQNKGCLFVYFHSILSNCMSCYVLNMLHSLNKVIVNIITFLKRGGGSIMPPAKLLHYRYMVVPFQYGLVYLCVALYQIW